MEPVSGTLFRDTLEVWVGLSNLFGIGRLEFPFDLVLLGLPFEIWK